MNGLKTFWRRGKLGLALGLLLIGAAGCVGYGGGYYAGGGYYDDWGPDAYVFGGYRGGHDHDHDFGHRGAVSRSAGGFHGGGFHGGGGGRGR